MKDFGHLNYGINPKVPAERKIEWVNGLDGPGNEDVTEATYKSYTTKAQNKRFESSTKVGCVFSMTIWSEFQVKQYIDDDHREDAPHFSFRLLKHCDHR